MHFTFLKTMLINSNFLFRITLLFFAMVFFSALSHAAFNLESTGIILSENDPRVSFNIKNTSQNPIILVTKLKDLDEKELSKSILISPPITRINPGKSQQINFVLKKNVVLKDEVLLKASFEGVEQTKSHTATLPVRQDIGFLIIPNSIVQTREPWKNLTVKQENQSLVISNNGHSVVRLGPQVSLNPSNKNLSLDTLYILPGQSKRLDSSEYVHSITITPLSRYGLTLLPVDIQLD